MEDEVRSGHMVERKPEPGEATERTSKGYEVRVPKRREFFSNLKKIAKADKADKARSAKRSPPK
jgi:hypothetical protein